MSEIQVNSWIRVRDEAFEVPKKASKDSITYHQLSKKFKIDHKVRPLKKPGRCKRNFVGRVRSIDGNMVIIELRSGENTLAHITKCEEVPEPDYNKKRKKRDLDKYQTEMF